MHSLPAAVLLEAGTGQVDDDADEALENVSRNTCIHEGNSLKARAWSVDSTSSLCWLMWGAKDRAQAGCHDRRHNVQA